MRAAAGAAVARIETTHTYAASLGYRIKRQTRLGVGVGYAKRDSTTQLARGYDGLRFLTTISSELSR